MKKLLALILAAVMVLAMAACSATEAPETTPAGGNSETAAPMTFTVTVVHADGSEKEFTYESSEKFVGPVLTEAGLIKGNAGPYGLEITEVDGEKAVYATDGAYWAVYEGDQYAMTGIDGVKIVDGASYTLKYEKG